MKLFGNSKAPKNLAENRERKTVSTSRRRREVQVEEPRNKKPKPRKKKNGSVVLLVILIIILTIFALAIRFIAEPDLTPQGNKSDEIGKIENDGAIDGVDGGDRKDGVYTIILFGTDMDNIHTDSMMLLYCDTLHRKMSVTSIPRDTLVDVGRRVKKINSAWSYNGTPGQIDNLKREIKSIIGYKPDFYVNVKISGFVDMIDYLGGVEFDVQRDMYYEDPSQDLSIKVSKGKQILKGYDAMGVVRFRHTYANGDYDRIQVQQDFAKALMAKVMNPSTIPKLPRLAQMTFSNVETDLSAGNMIWLFKKFATKDFMTSPDFSQTPWWRCIEDIPFEPKLNFGTLPGESSYIGDGSYFTLYKKKSIEYINEYLNPFIEPITSEDVDIITSF